MSCHADESAEIEATLAKETFRPAEAYSYMVPFAASLAPKTFQRRDLLALSSLRFSRDAGSERELWISVWREILRYAQDDTAASASFDSQHLFFEMDWPLGWRWCSVTGILITTRSYPRAFRNATLH